MAKFPRSKSLFWRVVAHHHLFDVGAAVAALIAGVATLKRWGTFTSSDWLVVIALAIAFLCSSCKAVLGWWQHDRLDSPHDLQSCLHTLHELLLATVDADEAELPRVRLTIHVPVNGGQELEQSLEYVGDSSSASRAGRRFPAQSGIIGAAFRNNEMYIASRTNDDARGYVKELKEEWGYTLRDAEQRDQAAMSWLAIPLSESDDSGNPKGEVDAVVYFDSTEKTFFDDETRQMIAAIGCMGIARFASQRYK